MQANEVVVNTMTKEEYEKRKIQLEKKKAKLMEDLNSGVIKDQEKLKQAVASLKDINASLKIVNEQLKTENEKLLAENKRLKKENDELKKKSASQIVTKIQDIV